MKKHYVLFHANDATIFNNQRPVKISKNDVILENPDLQFVVGISPHYWKLVDGRVFPMNMAERALKRATHVKHVKKFNAVQWSKIGERVFWCTVFFAVGFGVAYYLTRTGRI